LKFKKKPECAVIVSFTEYESSSSVLTKEFSLVDGDIRKESSGFLALGTATKKKILFDDFLGEMNGAKSNVAFGYGVADATLNTPITIVSKKKLETHKNAISRSKDNFKYESGPGILMLDYDPSERGYSVEYSVDFIAIISDIFAEFKCCAIIARSSVSAGVFKEGEYFTNINKGHHIYFPALNASDIPRFGKVLYKRLWLAGFGHIDISIKGVKLERTIIDAAVFSPERLDFVAKPVLTTTGLSYSEPEVHQQAGGYLDTELLVDLTEQEQNDYLQLVENKKDASSEDADKISEKWETDTINSMIKKGVPENAAISQVKSIGQEQDKDNFLSQDFMLSFDVFGDVTVRDVLNNKEKYNNQALADPYEGAEYGATTAKIWITENSNKYDMYINSNAHGGCNYGLKKEPDIKKSKQKEVHLKSGDKHNVVSECEQILREEGSIYEFCKNIVSVASVKNDNNLTESSKRIIPVDPVRLTDILMESAKFKRLDSNKKWVPTNLPLTYGATLLSRKNWNLPLLRGVINTPTLREDGSILQDQGYDEVSGIFYDSNRDFPKIPEKPGINEALAALKVLQTALETFEFESDVDSSTMITAILTALVRKNIDNAPLFLMTSPKMGSGKGLLVNMISQLVTGRDASVMSQTSDENEERKRLMSSLLAGNQIICIDNIENNFQSETLCSVLTMSTLTDRVLGKSQMVEASTQISFLATGNNVTVAGDLTRRVLPISIDPKVEKPFERTFERHLPSYISDHRGELVVAALTILRAYHVAGKPKQNLSAFGSFEIWSSLIRGAVVWIGLSDPCEGLRRWEKIDPIRADVLSVLENCYEVFQGDSFTVKDLVSSSSRDLNDALLMVSGKQGRINSRSLGRWLVKYDKRIEGGHCLEIMGKSGSKMKYRIKRVA